MHKGKHTMLQNYKDIDNEFSVGTTEVFDTTQLGQTTVYV